MTSTEEFELYAAVFEKMTGYLVPGKDVAPQAYSESYDFRRGLYEHWHKTNNHVIQCVIKAMEDAA